jgi:hypothetical protein
MRKARFYISITPNEEGFEVHLQDYVPDEHLKAGQKRSLRLLLGYNARNLRSIAKAIEQMADDIDGKAVGSRYEIRDIPIEVKL